jgi:hypothetical protein
MWCLGLAAAGAALTPATGGAPVAALVAAVVASPVGNFLYDALKALDRSVFELLLKEKGGIEDSRVVATTLRRAQLGALETLRTQVRIPWTQERNSWSYEEEAEHLFNKRLEQFIKEQTKPKNIEAYCINDGSDLHELSIRKLLLDRMSATFDYSLATQAKGIEQSEIIESVDRIRDLAEFAVLAELRLTLLAEDQTIPLQFDRLFHDSWFDLFVSDAMVRFNSNNGSDGPSFAQNWNAAQQAMANAILTANLKISHEIAENLQKVLANREKLLENQEPGLQDSANFSNEQVFIPELKSGGFGQLTLEYETDVNAKCDNFDRIIGASDLVAISYFGAVSDVMHRLEDLDRDPYRMLSRSKWWRKQDLHERQEFAAARHSEISETRKRLTRILGSNTAGLRLLMEQIQQVEVDDTVKKSALLTFGKFAALRVIVALKSFWDVDPEMGTFRQHFDSYVFSHQMSGPFFDLVPKSSDTGQLIFGFRHYLCARVDPYSGTATVQLPLDVWRKLRAVRRHNSDVRDEAFFTWVAPQLVLFEHKAVTNNEVRADNWWLSSVRGFANEYYGEDIDDPWPDYHF